MLFRRTTLALEMTASSAFLLTLAPRLRILPSMNVQREPADSSVCPKDIGPETGVSMKNVSNYSSESDDFQVSGKTVKFIRDAWPRNGEILPVVDYDPYRYSVNRCQTDEVKISTQEKHFGIHRASIDLFIRGVSVMHSLLLFVLMTTAAALENPGFETVKANGNVNGWTQQGWNSDVPPQVTIETTGAAEGLRAISVAAVAKGGAGLSSTGVPFDGVTSWRCRVGIRASDDYSGNVPWLFAAWYDGNKYIGNTPLPSIPLPAKNWTHIEMRIPADGSPVGANRMAICLATRASGISEVSGRLWFDDIILIPDSMLSIALVCDHFAQWTSVGDPITFRLARGKLPKSVGLMRGQVYNSSGVKVDEQCIGADIFFDSGWTWRPTLPGYYEVGFTADCLDGTVKPLISAWSPSMPSGKILSLERNRWSMAVAATPTRSINLRPAHFGFTWDYNQGEEELRLGDLIGCSAVRFQQVPWGSANTKIAVEPERGVFQWSELDKRVDWMTARGLRVIAQVLGTPRWASPHPEDEKTYICMTGFTIWAPKDLGDWTRFLEVIVRRYRDRISTWEIWNEPHLPGGSCYWLDTPERYRELLSSGYRAIKSVQPDSEVWIGGMANRYVPFYRELTRLNGTGSYDRLSMHGSACDPSPFYALDRTIGQSPRPWVDSEYHGILLNPSMQGDFPDEMALSRRLVLDAFGQFARGAGLICLFEMTNQIEREMLLPARQDGWFTHAAGLFRRRPRVEARLPALVWHTVMAQVEPGMTVRSQHRMGEVRVVACSNGANDLLLVWHDGAGPEPMPPTLIACGGTAIDWEGRPLPAGAALPPKVIILIRQADRLRVSALPVGEALPSVRVGIPATNSVANIHARVYWGSLPSTPIFTPMTSYQDGATAEDVRAKFAVAANARQVEVRVDVLDPEHVSVEQPGSYWKGDSVQFGFDTGGDGQAGDQVQFQVALTKDGPVVWKDVAPWIGGDLPSRWTQAGRIAAHASARVDPIQGGFRYHVTVEVGELYPLMIDKGRQLKFSLLVNSNRGHGRQGWLEWGAGIGRDFTPVGYGILDWDSTGNQDVKAGGEP